jgi:hypothetical protein
MNGSYTVEGQGRVDNLRYSKGCQHVLVDSSGARIRISCNSPTNPNVGSCPQPMGERGRFCLSGSSGQCQYSRASPTVKSNAFRRR